MKTRPPSASSTARQLPECHQNTSAPPMASPATTCTQNPYGRRAPRSIVAPTTSSESPTTADTTADQFPPFEMKSVTNSHHSPATGSASNGWRKRRANDAANSSVSSTITWRARWKPSKAFAPVDQPNQCQSAARNAANAATEMNANTPAASALRADRASPSSTTRMSSAHAAYAPWPYCDCRYWREYEAATPIVSTPE